jgi:PIN domain
LNRYLDTSFVAPLIREETISVPVTQFVAGLPPGELAISRWTEVEVASLLARDVRTGVIKSGEARKADMLLGDIVRRSFVVLSPSVGDYDLARRCLTPTRAACAREKHCISRSRRIVEPTSSTVSTKR